MEGHLVPRALDAGEASYRAYPLVQLGHQPTASYLHRRLKVHDLVCDVELVVDGLGTSIATRQSIAELFHMTNGIQQNDMP